VKSGAFKKLQMERTKSTNELGRDRRCERFTLVVVADDDRGTDCVDTVGDGYCGDWVGMERACSRSEEMISTC